MPKWIRVKSIIGDNVVLLKPSQIIPKRSLFIESVNEGEIKLCLKKGKFFLLRKNGTIVAEELIELCQADTLEIEPIKILLEVEK
ncbi:MAG: hypothetical protein OEW23_18130 [Candidatus Aminicenantes bacterium]|nr:hypothetical protein [Candidatus Aminicenantes bacterium]